MTTLHYTALHCSEITLECTVLDNRTIVRVVVGKILPIELLSMDNGDSPNQGHGGDDDGVMMVTVNIFTTLIIYLGTFRVMLQYFE